MFNAFQNILGKNESNKIPDILNKYMDADNIVNFLDDDDLEEIGKIVIEDYEKDKNSRTQWEEVMKKAFEIIAINAKQKNTPLENSANVKYPITLGACMQGNARLMPLIMKDEKLVKTKIFAQDDPEHILSDTASRIANHMTYQMTEECSYWIKNTDKLTIMLFFLGIVYRKIYFDPIEGQPKWILCLPDDVIINDKTTELERAERISHILYLTTNEIIENQKAELFSEIDINDLGQQALTGAKQRELENIDLKNSGNINVTKGFTTKANKYNPASLAVIHQCIEQHRWLDLDGDGYQEPYIVTVHKDSQKVLRIKARYNYKSFKFGKNNKFIKIIPINYFTDYHLIPNPNGSFHSLGLGALLYHTNETTNSIFNQLIDAGTLSNTGGGLLNASIRLPKGEYKIKPNEFQQVIVPPGVELQNSFVQFPFKEPSQTLFNLLSFLIESTKQITNVTDIMTGELPANVPATTTMAAMEESQKVFGAILSRFYDSLKSEFNKLYELNAEFLEEESSFPLAEGVAIIKRSDYQLPNIKIFPAADPKFTSQMQRMAQAQGLMGLLEQPEANRIAILLEYLSSLKFSNPKMFINIPDPNAPPSIQEQAAEEQLSVMKMEKVCMLLDRQLEALKIANEEAKVKSQSADYGVKAATQKVDSIVKLVQAHKIADEVEVARATKEEENLTDVTETQNLPVDTYQIIQELQRLVGQLLVGAQQQSGVGQELNPATVEGNTPPPLPPLEQMQPLEEQPNY